MIEGDEEKGSSVRKEEHMIAGEEEERVECGKKKNVLAEGGGEKDERGKRKHIRRGRGGRGVVECDEACEVNGVEGKKEGKKVERCICRDRKSK